MIRFDERDGRLTIDQTRRALRIAMWLFVGFGALGAAMMFVGPGPVKVRCDRADGACTIRQRSSHQRVALASITGVHVGDGELTLERVGDQPYHVCRAAPDRLAAAAAPLSAFLRDPTMPAAETSCATTAGGVPVAGKIAGVAGMLVIFALMGAFLVEAHTAVDPAAGTITMRGRTWPLRRWSLTRPLADVERVVVRRRYVGSGQRAYHVDVAFTDGTFARAFSPAAMRLSTLDERIATLRRHLGRPEPSDRY